MSVHGFRSKRGRRVTVVLGLCDGAAHLEDQLQSYLDQTLPPTRVLASDDSRAATTRAAFQAFSETAPATIAWNMLRGPSKGAAANFLHLLACVPPEDCDYVALSDQDDIWLPEKLDSAVAQIAPYGDHPVLLGSRSWEWDADRDQRQLSRAVPGPLGFGHALVQNFAGGNTMVLNRAALDLVQSALPGLPVPAVHDWWLYQLISGAGGAVLLDPIPQILYRQHPGNVIGANNSLKAKLKRLAMMLGGTYRGWMDQNIAALETCAPLLTPDAQALLARLKSERDGPLRTRLRLLATSGLHRKGCLNQGALWLAAALHRL